MTARLPKKLKRTVIYKNPWMDLYVDRVRYPEGTIVDKHHVLDIHSFAAATVVEDSQGRILLVKVYRYVTGGVQWEIPAGRGDPGETPIQTAAREVREESGYETKGHKLLYSYHPINGLSNHLFHIVACKASKKVGVHDPSEIKSVRWFSKNEIRRMIRQRKFIDGFSLTGLLLYLGVHK